MAPPGPGSAPVAARGLAGHEGHLSESQEQTLASFKEQLEKDGYYTPGSDATPASHDDSTLLRFLRARKFELAGALKQFESSEQWRKDDKVEELYDGFDVKEFDDSVKVYPQWTGRRDKAGLPIYLFKVGDLTKQAIDSYNKKGDRLQPRIVALYEHMVQFALPFASSIPREHPETPVTATTNIVDISGVSLSRFWALRSHMQRASTLANQNYAETLGSIYLIGAPNFFSVVWGWIGKWFDPGTVEKIFILASHEVLPTLTRFIDIKDIPKAYGGELDFAFNGGTGPVLDQPAKDALGLDKMPRGSIRFVDGGLVLKGTGRTEEEIKANTPAPKKAAAEPVVTPAATEAPVETKEDAAVEAKEVEEPVKENGHAENGHATNGYTVEDAARDQPEAPVKELAATLEGTTL